MPFWYISGLGCNFSDVYACSSNGVCARREFDRDKPQQDAPYVCCHSGGSVSFNSDTDGTAIDQVCDMQPIGANCFDSSMCESTNCLGYVCVPQQTNSTNATQIKRDLGQPCPKNHEVCKSGFCWDGICQQEPTICPSDFFVFLGGFRLDPYCRTIDDWCTINDWEAIIMNLHYSFGINITMSCYDLLEFFTAPENKDGALIKLVDEKEAEIGYTDDYAEYNDIENVLSDSWTYFILVCIAVVGFFALLSNVRWLLESETDNRARDYKIKCAAAFKIGNMIENALSMHPIAGSGSKGQVMVSMDVPIVVADPFMFMVLTL